MKIGVISDTHGCVQTWRQVFEAYLHDADLIIHAGDVLYHGPRNAIPGEYNPKELAQVLNACKVPIIIVQGNCDAEVDGMVLDIPITKSSLIYVNGLRIFTQHGHDLTTDQAAALAQRYQPDLLITGHTHLPALQRIGNTIMLNPGSPGMSKREDREGTIAVIEDHTVKIYAVIGGNALWEMSLINRS
jgi:putative phosphoesterase